MYTGNQKESPDMVYIKEQIEREKRRLDEFTKKLNFDKQENQKREEQFLRKQATELGKVRKLQQRQAEAFTENAKRTILFLQDKQKQSQSNLTHLEAEFTKAKQEFERQHKAARTSTPNNATNKADFINSPEMRRYMDEILLEKRHITEFDHKIAYEEKEVQNKLNHLAQTQKRELDQVTHQHQREHNSLTDSWRRGTKFIDDKIQATQFHLRRLELDFKQKEREFQMKQKELSQRKSDHRAKYGNDDTNPNYATPAKNGIANAPEEQSRTRRSLGGRW